MENCWRSMFHSNNLQCKILNILWHTGNLQCDMVVTHQMLQGTTAGSHPLLKIGADNRKQIPSNSWNDRKTVIIVTEAEPKSKLSFGKTLQLQGFWTLFVETHNNCFSQMPVRRVFRLRKFPKSFPRLLNQKIAKKTAGWWTVQSKVQEKTLMVQNLNLIDLGQGVEVEGYNPYLNIPSAVTQPILVSAATYIHWY